MRFFFAFLLPFLFFPLTPLLAQDTLSFGGIYDLPGAEVRASYTPVSPLAQSFTIEEVYRLPGTFYDPARLVALLPGVVQTNDQANHLSVRGNTPNANLWRLNGLAIVNPNHTANAGTFYDFPTLSGGGVNAISAQMLGNSGFLAGGLPVEYGFATGGTFDLRLRPGSKTRRKYQAQAGFIGFDLMAEGPIGNSGKTSYLVNGRYSFTGLLADMGVDFGGEEIRFADINAHLHHEWDGGEISAFAVLGRSSNVFRGPDSTEQEITEQKELFDIDFESEVEIYGLSFNHQFNRGELKGGIATSNTNSERIQVTSPLSLGTSASFLADTRTINANLQYSIKYNLEKSLEIGAEFIDFDSGVLSSFAGPPALNTGAENLILSPFVAYKFKTQNTLFDLGLRASAYLDGLNSIIDEFVLEPRLQIKYKWKRQSLTFLLEYISSDRPIIQYFTFDQGPIVNRQTSIGYKRKIGKVNLQITGFYQSSPKDKGVILNDFFISANNFHEIDLNYNFFSSFDVSTRRYGLELEFAGGKKDEGIYYRGSISTIKAETKQPDEKWTLDRFSADYIGKLAIGKEWSKKLENKNEKTLGINLSLVLHSGERYGRIIADNNGFGVSRYFSTPDVTGGFLNSTGTYFRPDLRLYKTKTRPKTTTTLALDVQNAANVQNTANVYYDAFLERPNERFQLGLIPVLSYRIVWR